MLTGNFVHLHCHSEYSLLGSTARIKDMVKQAADLGMPALAITDYGNMFGAFDFYRVAREAGVKPILGCEVYLAPRSRFLKEEEHDDLQYHLVLLAENNTGYHNLVKLVSIGYLEGFYHKPKVDRSLLKECSEGIIALSACLGGEIPTLIMQGKIEKVHHAAREYKEIFGQDNFFLELNDHGLPEQKTINERLLKISKAEGIPLVATNNVHYLFRQDAGVHDVLLCMQTGKTIEESERMRFKTEEYYFKTAEEMADLFASNEEAINNTMQIAARCNVENVFSKCSVSLPEYHLPVGKDPDSYLKELCYKGLDQRYGEITSEALSRLDYELDVIGLRDYSNYFLIVWDLIQYAKKEKVIVSPGRGSAASSLVLYVIGITNVDPLEYSLLFERFLNPEVIAMPDIVLDVCDDKRDHILQYVCNKYGYDRVAQTISFGSMAARAAIRDVGRVMAIPFAEVDKIARLIPNELKMTISKALEQSKELRALNKDKKYRKLLDTAMAVEGMPRHASIHAAGVVISKEPLINFIPLCKTTGDTMVTQFPMEILEDFEIFKMDFLELKALSVIRNTLENIEKSQGRVISIEKIVLNDENTYNLLSEGETIGIFQLESSGMRSVLKELRPNRFEDIIALIALYRPGSQEQLPVFIKSKHGIKEIKNAYPVLEPILNETYGIVVYQEQIIEIAARMAGLTLGQSDLLRRAIGMKQLEILDDQRLLFVEGSVKNGYSKEFAAETYELILKYAPCSVNKSHAAAYALIAYQTAYLKANYPTEFMAAIMTVYYANSDKVALYIAECKRMGIEVMPPDINESEIGFTIVGENKIRHGLEK